MFEFGSTDCCGLLIGKPELKPKLLTEKHKAGELFYNLKEEIPFPALSLFYKINENIMLPGIHPWRLGSRVIKHEFLNILRRACLRKEASSFLLSVTSRVCIDLNLSRAFFSVHLHSWEQSLLIVYLWSQNINIFISPTLSLHSFLLNLIHYHCEIWLLFFLTQAVSSFLFHEFYFLSAFHTRTRKLGKDEYTHSSSHRSELTGQNLNSGLSALTYITLPPSSPNRTAEAMRSSMWARSAKAPGVWICFYVGANFLDSKLYITMYVKQNLTRSEPVSAPRTCIRNLSKYAKCQRHKKAVQLFLIWIRQMPWQCSQGTAATKLLETTQGWPYWCPLEAALYNGYKASPKIKLPEWESLIHIFLFVWP